MERDNAKRKNYDRCMKEMVDNPKYCNDNTHELVCQLFLDDYGIRLTPKMVTFIRSIDRERQRVLKNNIEMDIRGEATEDNYLNDTSFYRQN